MKSYLFIYNDHRLITFIAVFVTYLDNKKMIGTNCSISEWTITTEVQWYDESGINLTRRSDRRV